MATTSTTRRTTCDESIPTGPRVSLGSRRSNGATAPSPSTPTTTRPAVEVTVGPAPAQPGMSGKVAKYDSCVEIGDDVASSLGFDAGTRHRSDYVFDHYSFVGCAFDRMEDVRTQRLRVGSPKVPNAVFDLLDTLPSFTRPKATFPNRTTQLVRLAAALNEHSLVTNASLKVRSWIVDQMRAGDSQRKEEIDANVKDILALTVGTTVVSYGEAIMLSVGEEEAQTSERDLDGYYNRAVRLLPDGSASWYYNDLCDRGYDEVDAAVRVTAMAQLGFKALVEEQAAALIDDWRDKFQSAVSRMQRTVRDLIEPLWYLGTTPMHPTTVEARDVYPASTERIKGNTTESIGTYPSHLYVIPAGKTEAGRFPVDTSRSSWEAAVLNAELNSPTLVGWYRNPSSGRNALAVPYEFGDKFQLMHPDFLFWHDDGDGDYVMDIVDPHRHDLADTAAKWAALARYAQAHPDQVRRCLAIIKIGDQLRALSLTEPGIEVQIADATNKSLVEAVFGANGMDYP